MQCRNCGADIAQGGKFCTHCGTKLEVQPRCAGCGAELSRDSSFCSRCGTPVKAPATQQPVQKNIQADPIPAPHKTGKKRPVLLIVLIIAVAVSLLLGALLAVVLITGTGGKSDEALWQEQYDLGNRYLSEGKYEEAVIAFCAAIDIDPMRPEAYLGAVEAYKAQGDTQAAIDILEKGIRQTGDNDLQRQYQVFTEWTEQPETSEPNAPVTEAQEEETTQTNPVLIEKEDLVGEWTCYTQTASRTWDFFDLFLYEDGTAKVQWSSAWSEYWYGYDGTWRIIEVDGTEAAIELDLVGGNIDMETGQPNDSHQCVLLVRPEGDVMYVSKQSGDDLALCYDAYYRRDLSHQEWYEQHSY